MPPHLSHTVMSESSKDIVVAPESYVELIRETKPAALTSGKSVRASDAQTTATLKIMWLPLPNTYESRVKDACCQQCSVGFSPASHPN